MTFRDPAALGPCNDTLGSRGDISSAEHNSVLDVRDQKPDDLNYLMIFISLSLPSQVRRSFLSLHGIRSTSHSVHPTRLIQISLRRLEIAIAALAMLPYPR